jgi:hypothetical protein
MGSGKVPSLGLYDLISFRVWKINALTLKNDFPADYEYWVKNGLFDKDYYYETTINPFKTTLARLIEPLIRIFLRRTFRGY